MTLCYHSVTTVSPLLLPTPATISSNPPGTGRATDFHEEQGIVAHYLELDLDDVAIDLELARRIPHDLAAYYLALPLGQENGRVSVALAHPENVTALATLHDLLQVDIVPVRSRAEQIRAAIERLHGSNGTSTMRVLTWSGTPDCESAVQQTAAGFAAAQDSTTALVHAGPVALDTALAVARERQVSLVVLSPPAGQRPDEVLSQCPTPLVLVRGAFRPIRRVLVATRGYASDDMVLDWLEPFLRAQGVEVVLLPLLRSTVLELDDLLCTDGPFKHHLDHLLRRLTGERISASLHLRPGDPATQVVAELRQHDYDMLVMAAESYGHFVGQVLDLLEQQTVHQGRSVFILKPTDLPMNGSYGGGLTDAGQMGRASQT